MELGLDVLWGAGGMVGLVVAITGGEISVFGVELPPVGLIQRLLFGVLGIALMALALILQRRGRAR